MQWARAGDGRSMCFAEYGDPAGWPVFSMHGAPGCRLLLTAAHQLGLPDLLGELGVRLIRHDRPGLGRSDRQPGRRILDTAADVAAIADSLGIGRFAVVGGSAGTGHALAAAAALAERVTGVAVTAPAAPYAVLGHDAYTAGMNPRVVAYVEAIRNGREAMLADFGHEDAELRAGASVDDPNQAWIFEETRQGLDGWMDDEIANTSPWGFDVESIRCPTSIWHDPDETTLPPQHAAWLAAHIAGAELVVTHALGHGSPEDPRGDWRRLYTWLVNPVPSAELT